MDMLSFALIREGNRPLYEQLYQQIRQEIIEGRLAYGTKLPSKRKLGQFLNLSQTTIELAYQQLVAEGYVESVSRKGYFVLAYEELAYVKTTPLPTSQRTNQKPAMRYDFHPSKIDGSSFPFSRWRKHAKDVVDEQNQSLVSLGHPQGVRRLQPARPSRPRGSWRARSRARPSSSTATSFTRPPVPTCWAIRPRPWPWPSTTLPAEASRSRRAG